jgi:hypothetical protein
MLADTRVVSRSIFDNSRLGFRGAGALARGPTPWSGLSKPFGFRACRAQAGRGRAVRSRGTAPHGLSALMRDRTLADRVGPSHPFY